MKKLLWSAELVRKTRQQLGMTQKQFAAKLGVSYRSVNRWENGWTMPLQLALKQIEELVKQPFPDENNVSYLKIVSSMPLGTLYTSMEQFVEQIENWRKRLDKLQVSLSSSGQPDLLTAAFDEFDMALEELQLAQEELLQHNEELQTTRQTVEAERHRYQELFDFAPDGYLVTDAKATIREANRAAAELLNVPQNFLVGKPLDIFFTEEVRRVFLAKLKQLHLSYQVQKWEVCLQPRSSVAFDAALTVASVHNSQGNLTALRWLVRDMSERKQVEILRQHAFYDALTRLPNRALFMNRLEHAIKRLKRHKDYVFAVLFLDLDRFKVINDSLGHILGDQFLIAIANRLKAYLRPTDTAARLGGDEFTILLDSINDVSDAIKIAERIQQELALPIDLEGQEVFSTVSIGIALSATGYNQPEEILRDADMAMYRAKALGKARYEIFNTDMYATAMTRLQLETDLRRAIERQEFRVYYQPIVSLHNGKISGFEALVRWQHPERGLICPDSFIPVAEETGLIVSIGYWVLREACRQMQAWLVYRDAASPLKISVNLSQKQFFQPDLIQQILQILRQTELDICSLDLEITESVIMENDQLATTTISKLRHLGIQLSIDDFGTGYSSLARLHRFPINVLKIDRSFVSGMGSDQGNLEITETIVTLAHKLGVNVTAEGVETAEQLAHLRELKCEYGQGHFFSHPLDSEAAEALIMTNPQW